MERRARQATPAIKVAVNPAALRGLSAFILPTSCVIRGPKPERRPRAEQYPPQGVVSCCYRSAPRLCVSELHTAILMVRNRDDERQKSQHQQQDCDYANAVHLQAPVRGSANQTALVLRIAPPGTIQGPMDRFYALGASHLCRSSDNQIGGSIGRLLDESRSVCTQNPVNKWNHDFSAAFARVLARAWAFRHPRSALANARSKSHRLL